MSNIAYKISVMQEFERGEQIEARYRQCCCDNKGWKLTRDPSWDWLNFDFRVAKTCFDDLGDLNKIGLAKDDFPRAGEWWLATNSGFKYDKILVEVIEYNRKLIVAHYIEYNKKTHSAHFCRYNNNVGWGWTFAINGLARRFIKKAREKDIAELKVEHECTNIY